MLASIRERSVVSIAFKVGQLVPGFTRARQLCNRGLKRARHRPSRASRAPVSSVPLNASLHPSSRDQQIIRSLSLEINRISSRVSIDARSCSFHGGIRESRLNCSVVRVSRRRREEQSEGVSRRAAARHFGTQTDFEFTGRGKKFPGVQRRRKAFRRTCSKPDLPSALPVRGRKGYFSETIQLRSVWQVLL